MFNSWGFPARRIPLSGALKSEGMDSDLRVEILGKERKLESKKRSNYDGYYKRFEIPKHIKDFCIVMMEEDFHNLLLGNKIEVTEEEDKKLKQLHGFFEQDSSDIVAMKSNFKPWIFAITINLWEELNV